MERLLVKKRAADGPTHESAKRAKKTDGNETGDAALGGPSSVGSSASLISQCPSSSGTLDIHVKQEVVSDSFAAHDAPLPSLGFTMVRVKQEVFSDDSAEESDHVDSALFSTEFSAEQEDARDPPSTTPSLGEVHVKQECIGDDDTYGSFTVEHHQEVFTELPPSHSLHCATPGGVEVHVKQECFSGEDVNDPSAREHPQTVPVNASLLDEHVAGLDDAVVHVKQECVNDEDVNCPSALEQLITVPLEAPLQDNHVTGLDGMEVCVKQEQEGDEEIGNPFAVEAYREIDAGSLILPDQISGDPCVETAEIKQEPDDQLFIVQGSHNVSTSTMAVPLDTNEGNSVRAFLLPNIASLGQVVQIVSPGTGGAPSRTTHVVINKQATNVALGNFPADTNHRGSNVISAPARPMYVASYNTGNGTQMRVVNPNFAIVPRSKLVQQPTSATTRAVHAEKKAPVKASSSLTKPVPAARVKVEKVDKCIQACLKPESRTVSVQTNTCVRSISVQTEESGSDPIATTSTASHCTLSLASADKPSSSKATTGAAKDFRPPRKYVVSGSSLLKLLDKCQNCLLPVVPEVKVNGTLVEMSAVCAKGHLTTWRNQPAKVP